MVCWANRAPGLWYNNIWTCLYALRCNRSTPSRPIRRDGDSPRQIQAQNWKSKPRSANVRSSLCDTLGNRGSSCRKQVACEARRGEATTTCVPGRRLTARVHGCFPPSNMRRAVTLLCHLSHRSASAQIYDRTATAVCFSKRVEGHRT